MGHRSYYQKILDPREAPFDMALEMQVDYSRISRIIEDHLENDLQPAEAASEAVDEVLNVHVNVSRKPVNSPEVPEFAKAFVRHPCRARAVRSYRAPTDIPSWLSFEQNEVLQVATFSGTSWQARKKNGQEGRAFSHFLIPHYPYLARARYTMYNPFISENEVLNVSDEEELNRRPEDSVPPALWRAWRKKTRFHRFQAS